MKKIIILGAGASGLMAGYILSKQGFNIEIIEAQDRIGGRIKSKNTNSFPYFLELGAEFVHGNLPTTLQLLDEAKIPYYKTEGEIWNYEEGVFNQDDNFSEYFEAFHEKLSQLTEDCSVYEFLENNFKGEKYSQLRKSILNFVQGYDGADPNEMSVFSLREENPDNEEEDEYTIEGGYSSLMEYLYLKCRENGVNFHFSEIITHTNWKKNKVFLTSKSNKEYKAEKVIFTLPIALLQQESIEFKPQIPEYISAANEIGSGHAIKFIFQFNSEFFKTSKMSKLEDLHLLLSNEEIPTWWMHKTKPALLTGWLGGPKAFELRNSSNEELLNRSLKTLHHFFDLPENILFENLENWEISVPTADPFAKCAYSYDKINSEEARAVLNTPIEQTLYFAGEALYTGDATGTVEAALITGENTAKKIIQLK
ncbi:MAG: NAD(P)/FAD-dependent oxidoreductase [Chryseobacterium sp.]